MIILLLIIMFVFLLATYKKMGVFSIFHAYYFLVMLYTYIGVEIYSFAEDIPFSFYSEVDYNSRVNVYLLMFFTAMCFSLSCLFFKKMFNLTYNLELEANLFRVRPFVIVFLVAITLLFLHVGSGVDNLYSRIGYSGATGSAVARTIYTILLPITCLFLPFLKRKYLRMVLFLTLVIFVQGTSSRNLVLIPSMYFVGSLLRDGRVNFSKMLIFVSLSIVFSSYALQYRDNYYQGIIPNFISFVERGIEFDGIIKSLNYLLSFSFASIAYSLQDFQFNVQSLFYSISPLPSKYIDVDLMMGYQVLNKFAPMPALGFLGLGGYFYVFFYIFCSCFFWAFSTKVFGVNKFVGLIIIVLFIIFSLLSIQYNLRAINRLVFYSVFLSAITILMSRLKVKAN